MNNRSAKLLRFGLVITLFSLMLVNVASAVIISSRPVRSEAFIIIWLAIIAGIGSLFVGWFGLNRNE